VTGAFLDHGAPADIAGRQKPHVGTDLLRGVIRSIRGEIEVLGGEVRFNTALTGLHTRNGALTGIETEAGPVPCEQMILAVGHSARDTFGSCTAWACRWNASRSPSASAPSTCRPRSTKASTTARRVTRRCRRGSTS